MFGYANMVVLKVTRDCNLRCEYCYIHNKDNFKNEVIEFEDYKKIINTIIEDRIKSQKTKEDISVVFHGGEPTMIGSEYMTKLLFYAEERFIENSIAYKFSIQTNMTNINNEFAKLFSRFGVGVGYSFDGVEKDSNSKRAKNLNDKFFENKIDVLNEYGANSGPLMVLNTANKDYVLESIKYVYDNYKKSIKVNYAEDVNTNDVAFSESELTGKEFFEKSIKRILDEYIENPETEIKESNVDLMISKYLLDRLCITENVSNRGNCGTKICGGGIMVVETEPNGKAYYCGRYKQEFKESFIGNSWDKDFLTLNQIKRYLDFTKAKHDVLIKTGCDTCIANSICDYGCMAFHFSKTGDWGIREKLVCDIYKNAYDYMFKNEKGIVNYFLRHRNDLHSSAIILKEKSNALSNYIQKLGYRINVERIGKINFSKEQKVNR